MLVAEEGLLETNRSEISSVEFLPSLDAARKLFGLRSDANANVDVGVGDGVRKITCNGKVKNGLLPPLLMA